MLAKIINILNTHFIKTPSKNFKSCLDSIHNIHKGNTEIYENLIPSIFKTRTMFNKNSFVSLDTMTTIPFQYIPEEYTSLKCNYDSIINDNTNLNTNTNSIKNLTNLKSLENKVNIPRYIEPFDRKISRTKLFENDYYEIILIGWEPNAKSTIHNHSNNGCVFFLIQGDLVEEVYDTKNIELISISNILKNEIGYIDDTIGYHRMKNANNTYSFSIHIYSPPNFVMNTF